jgi:hypothetical protein
VERDEWKTIWAASLDGANIESTTDHRRLKINWGCEYEQELTPEQVHEVLYALARWLIAIPRNI